jgi:cytosine/adenosine deaminase-related metal-dependent hydrolase
LDRQQIIWAGTAITGENFTPCHNFAVCVERNLILATGSRDELYSLYPNAEIIGSDRLLLLPGMVNSHDHGRALSTVAQGVPDDQLEIWLMHLGTLPQIDPYLAAAYDGIRLLSSGVTTVAHSHNPRNWKNIAQEAAATIAGYRDAGIRVAFHPPIVDQNLLVYDQESQFLKQLPPNVKQLAEAFREPPPLSTQDYFQLCNDLWHAYHDSVNHNVHIQVSPAGGQWCSDELIMTAVEFAVSHQTKVQMHLLETSYQQQYAYRKWNKSFVQHLREIGAIGSWLTCAHMVWVEPEDLSCLADSKVGIAHNPSSNLRLNSGIAPIAQMLARGIPLGIGLDGLTLDDDQDFLREMRLAWTLSKYSQKNASKVDASSIWQMGTTGGVAVTFGENVPLGKLVPGYLADLVLINWEDKSSLTLDKLLRCLNHHQVNSVMVAGRWVLKNGQSQRLDRETIEQEIQWQVKHQSRNQLQQSPTAANILAPYLRSFYSQWQ